MPTILRGADNILSTEILQTGEYTNTMKETDATNRSFTTSWAVGSTWSNFLKKEGNAVLLLASIPVRNDSTSWGGFYCRIEYSIDNGAIWVSLGDTGYDTVMNLPVSSIRHWDGGQIIDLPAIVNSTQVKFRFQHRSYDGTVTIRTSNNITNGPAYEFGDTQITLIEIGV